MALYEGTTMRIKVGAKTLFHETDATFSSSMSVKEVASKDTTGVVTSPGQISWSLSASSLIGNDGTVSEDLATLLASHLAKELVTVEFTTDVTGDVVIAGSCYIETCNVKATHEETVTGDFSFKGDGIYTVGAVPV